ncbi:SDR family oxidoreductase [Trinickia fusca]|uniref:SDR family oxidoreductase n=1 Tax=Trinickia fusca TaxID=2419777 RepID=A0A494XEG8_9BURK|nr:SDR family oxidoreductase [Trinickia fusca]RKP45993.1 SDR family oxidoreductase [Trinickia fusca]
MSATTLQDKVIVIGGGAKNLGGAMARHYAANGAGAIAVHYNSDATRGAAQETVAAVEAAGAKALAIQGDLTKVSEVTRLFDETIAAFGRVDIAINTTGMIVKKPMADVTEDDYDKSFAINSKAAFFFMQEAGKKLVDGGKLCTVVTSLLGAFTGLYAIYAGSKAPVEHFTRAAAKEFGERGISVTAVAPGPMETPFFYGQETPDSTRYHQTAAALSPFTRTGLTDPHDIVTLVQYLVTDGWWITGQTILANGGYTTK